MKNKVAQILVSLLLSLTFVFTSTRFVQAENVSYDITQATINADISADGNVAFRDIYTYDVDYINGVYHIIDYGDYAISDYRIGILDEDTNDINYLPESFNRSAGTFLTSDDGETLTVQIFYPGENEEIHFVIEFTLEGLVMNYNDTAEFNRKIVGENWSDSFDVQAQITLPGAVENDDDFRVWSHGHYAGEVYPVTESNHSYIELAVPDNPAGQFVEVQTIFPTSLTPNNPNVTPVNMKHEIIEAQETQTQQDREAYESRRNRIWLIVALLFISFPLITIVAGGYYVWHHRRLNPEPAHVPEHLYAIPEDVTPAIMATTVLRKSPIADDFSATLVDLARKGYIIVEEVSRSRRGIFSHKGASTVSISPAENQPDWNDLMKHERYVYEYLLPNNEPITLAQIEEKINSNKNFKKQQYRKWTQFVNYVEVMGTQARKEPRERRNSQVLSIVALLFALTLPILGFLIISDTPVQTYLVLFMTLAIVNVFLAIVILLVTYLRPIRTYEEDKRLKEWQSFANMLDNIGNFNMREIASLPMWEEFLSYAISLDVADKVIEAMNDEYGIEELNQMHMPMIFYSNPYWINQVVRPTVSQSIQSSTPAQSAGKHSGSNTGGFGGGFSGGSSGGSGGGGGGGGF